MRRISTIFAACQILALAVACSAPDLAVAPLPTPYETEEPIKRLPVAALEQTPEPASPSTAIAAVPPQATPRSAPSKPESQQSAPRAAAKTEAPPEPSRREPQPAAATPISAPTPDFEAASRELTPFGRNCPPDNPIKGAVDEQGNKRYYVPSGADYAKITPSSCFPTVQEARAAGFRPAAE